MRKTLAVAMLCGLTGIGARVAEQPLKLTIQTEGVNLPSGSICRAEVAAEYRIVEPRVSTEDRGKHVPVTNDMTTFAARAPERHEWRFAAARDRRASQAIERENFEFMIPAGLPRAHRGARAGIYVPVAYSISVPGFPELRQQQTFVIRFDESSKKLTRCLRFELMNGSELRVGLLPTCGHTFEQLGALPLTAD